MFYLARQSIACVSSTRHTILAASVYQSKEKRRHSSTMKFNPDTDIPNLEGKVILVTGGNIGLGYESIYQLAKHSPAQIYLAARSQEKAEAAISKIKSSLKTSEAGSNTPIHFLSLDLTSFKSIEAAAAEFQSKSPRLDILMLNAGIMAHPPGLTKDGYEIQFGTNHVGHALLTKLLLPTLKKTAAEQRPGSDVRVITLSSSAHHWAPKTGYILSDVRTDMAKTSTWARYGQSKLANIHWSRSLANAHPELRCVSLHPGSVSTNLISGPMASYPLFGWIIPIWSRFRQTPVAEGAWNQLWAATSSDAESGVFYYPVALTGKDSELAKDEALREELWEWTEKELARF